MDTIIKEWKDILDSRCDADLEIIHEYVTTNNAADYKELLSCDELYYHINRLRKVVNRLNMAYTSQNDKELV